MARVYLLFFARTNALPTTNVTFVIEKRHCKRPGLKLFAEPYNARDD